LLSCLLNSERKGELKVKELKFPSKKTIEKLTKELNLKGANEYTQDWECEVANINQLPDYIKYYISNELSLNEKSTLMRIILEAYNDYISLESQEDIYGKSIEEILNRDYYIHKDTVTYWSCEGEDLSECFTISAFMRKI